LSNETEYLKAQIDIALRDAKLTAWQRNFLTDIRARFDRHGNRTRLSDKQLEKLHEIIGGGNKVVLLPLSMFDTSSQMKRRPRAGKQSLLKREVRWWARRFLRDFAFAAALIAGLLAYSFFDEIPRLFSSNRQVYSTNVDGREFTVTDGDTIHISGEISGLRLVGFNTPETRSPQCDRECELGNRATARLKELVATSRLQLTKVACACRPGTEGTETCNYRRSCGILMVDGRDVGQILISEGLAVSFVCSGSSCPPTPRPWCG
jgi:micrococcal nuclease